MTLLGALWLGLFPLWHDGSYTRITRAKWYGMLALSAVTAAVALTLLVTRLCQRRRPNVHPIQGIAAAYLAWLGLSALFGGMADSVNSQGQLTVWMGAIRYEGLATQGCYVLLFLLMSLFPARPRIVLNAAAVAALIYGGFVALQYAGFNLFGLFPRELSIRTVPEFQGPIGNIDMVSAWLCLLTPVLLFSFSLGETGPLCLLAGCAGMLLLLLMEVQSGLLTMAAVLAALMLLILLRPEARARGCLVAGCALAVFSLRRLLGLPWYDGTERILFPHAPTAGKLLILTLACLLVLLALRLRRHPGPAMPKRWLLPLVALSLVAGLVALLLLPLPEGSGLWELQEVLHGRPQDSFGSERLGIWRLTLEMAREHLIFGTGPDTFYYAMQRYMTETGQQLQQTFDNPHNMLLAVLSGSGLPALTLYLALITAAAVMCLRAFPRSRWTLAMLAGLAAYQLQGLFTFSICLVSPMFWVMLGMAVSQACPKEALSDESQFRAAHAHAQDHPA